MTASASTQISVLDEPEKVGLSGERLERIRPFFDERYVATGKLAGVLTLVARRGQVAHLGCCGLRNVATGEAMTPDTIFRIYSMTKPIVSVALMTLYEEGRFQLDDPVSRFIPAWADLRVWSDGNPDSYATTFPEREMQIRDLLTHTSGLTYGFMARHPVDSLYRRRGVDADGSETLAEMVDKLAELPLLFSPGTRWSYSVATDVCGHLCEVLSGRPLDVLLRERIFEPLGMVDTGFSVPEAEAAPPGRQLRLDARGPAAALRRPGHVDLPDPAVVPLRRRRPRLHRARLPALRLDAGEPGRARRPAGAGPQDRRAHDAQPPARRRRPGAPWASGCSPRSATTASASGSASRSCWTRPGPA